MKVKGIFFDLYGTLLIYSDMSAAWSDWFLALYECLKDYGLSMPQESVIAYCNRFFGIPAPPPQEDGLTIFERRIQRLGVSLGLNLGKEEAQMIATSCVGSWQKYVSLDPDAIPVLQTLQSHKSLALISNFDHPPHIHSLLSTLNLTEFFDIIIISGEVGVRKPDPRIFSLALEATNLQPTEVVYVGDTLKDDVQGARAAGIFPVLIQRNRSNEAILDFESNRHTSQTKPKSTISFEPKIISNLSELVKLFL
ncbi:MAG: HAD family hydrolase [Candidatus Hermodarchaeota archaeon]